MIERRTDPQAAQGWCSERRRAGARLGLVPTMGALHEGHLTLVRAARARCNAVVASVFVNPLQFDDPRDFERYPRDFEADERALSGAGCDLVFTGTLEQFFPAANGRRERIPLLDPGPCALGLEGELRPGHFSGVATIVARLFELVRPDQAFFGAKDFQQTLVVRHVARAQGWPEIVVCPTSREPSGLARSSRNALLTPVQREQAAAIHKALLAARQAWRAGVRDASPLAERLRAALNGTPLEVEYAELRDPERWSACPASGSLERAIALVAARLGGVRLIDNLRLDGPETA